MKTCRRCSKEQPRANFVVDFHNPEEVLDMCRQCMIDMVQKPVYMKDALTNLIKEALTKDGYAGAMALVQTMLNKAIFDRDLPTMKMLLERMDGPLAQKIEITGDEEAKRLVMEADVIRAGLRSPPEASVH